MEIAQSVPFDQQNAPRVVGVPFTGKDDPRRWGKGKPRKPRVADAFWRIANQKLEGTDRTELDELCQAVWDKAKKGDSKCATLVFDRMEGKALQPVEDVTPQDGMTPEESKKRIAELLARAAIVSANADCG